MEDQLVEIPAKNYFDLLNLYSRDDVKTFLGHSAISYILRSHFSDDFFQTKEFSVYCLNGDWSDGTFVIDVSEFALIHMTEIIDNTFHSILNNTKFTLVLWMRTTIACTAC